MAHKGRVYIRSVLEKCNEERTWISERESNRENEKITY
jgi:hypothetical protein